MLKLFTASVDEEAEATEFSNEFKDDYHVYALPLPATIDFAGESAPMKLIDVSEKLDRELLVNTYWQSQTMLFIKRSNRWFPVIEPILKEEGVPDDFKYLALIESGFQQIVSPAGATGFSSAPFSSVGSANVISIAGMVVIIASVFIMVSAGVYGMTLTSSTNLG